MLRFLLNLGHRPAIRFGLARDSSSRFRNSHFASFLAQNNGQHGDPNRHDTVLRGRKFVRQALTILIGAGAVWVVVESARALSTF